MSENKKLMIGGQALRELGSCRHTDDVDYLVNVQEDWTFKHEANCDLINCNNNNFFAKIWKIEADNNGIASAQSLLELKAYAIVQHYQNGNMAKARTSAADIMFLVAECNLDRVITVKEFLTVAELEFVNEQIAAGMKYRNN